MRQALRASENRLAALPFRVSLRSCLAERQETPLVPELAAANGTFSWWRPYGP
jgi:hypothetical protein